MTYLVPVLILFLLKIANDWHRRHWDRTTGATLRLKLPSYIGEYPPGYIKRYNTISLAIIFATIYAIIGLLIDLT